MDRGSWGAYGTRLASVRPRLYAIPSSDRSFAAVVENVASRLALRSPYELEDALRPLYPLVSVHPRELTGEPASIWYVYRERTFPARPGSAKD
jgi:hypothetical protein